MITGYIFVADRDYIDCNNFICKLTKNVVLSNSITPITT